MEGSILCNRIGNVHKFISQAILIRLVLFNDYVSTYGERLLNKKVKGVTNVY